MSEIAEKVKSIIVAKLGVEASEVTPDASFTNDLGADSLDTVELIMELEKEFNDLREEIRQLKLDAKGLEPHERIQVVKTRAALVEKILSMKERIESIKKQQDFISTVLQLMEDELPQDLRLRVIEKLEPFAAEE
mgnify:CR=1 FL=1